MIRILLAAAALAVLSLLAPRPAHAQGDEQTLVDRSTLALQEMVNQALSDDPRRMLSRARGVMICPRVFKAGFFFGGEGGACVLLARAGNGTWSYPAFYGMGSGSFGLQIGIQDSQFIMLIMTREGPAARSWTASSSSAPMPRIAIATIGAGVQGVTTGALGADIIAFSQSRGLYGGISLRRQPDGPAQRVEPGLLRSPDRRAADRHGDAGRQPRRRSAARRADPLWQPSVAAGRRAAAAGLPAARQPISRSRRMALRRRTCSRVGRCSSRTCRPRPA